MSEGKQSSDKPVAAKRGEVAKSFQFVRVLAGHMDDQHFRVFAQEHLLSLTKAKQTALLNRAEKARQAVAKDLSIVDLTGVEIRPLEQSAYSKLLKDKTFQNVFGAMPYRFAWIRIDKLVALQVFVKSQQEEVPTDLKQLMDFALPNEWSIPAEISFIPPFGPIYIVSSSPQMAGLEVRMDDKKGQVIIQPPSHINLIQAVQFNGRYYLRNGYHRVVGALEAGITELPALVVDAVQPADVELGNLGVAGFGVVHSLSLPRPALVSDFTGKGVVDISMREKRYGASVSLQIAPVNIGV